VAELTPVVLKLSRGEMRLVQPRVTAHGEAMNVLSTQVCDQHALANLQTLVIATYLEEEACQMIKSSQRCDVVMLSESPGPLLVRAVIKKWTPIKCNRFLKPGNGAKPVAGSLQFKRFFNDPLEALCVKVDRKVRV
jgi:hypothetical protein